MERFGNAACELAVAVVRAIHEAHGRAMDAHISSMLQSNDAYGATLHVAQYEQLAAETREISGVAIRRPKDVRCRFELVVLQNPPVVLYPWRYATDNATTRERAKLRPPVSDLRKTLLPLNGNTISGQLTFDQADLDPEQLAAELAEEQAMLEQLARLGQVVTIGFERKDVSELASKVERKGKKEVIVTTRRHSTARSTSPQGSLGAEPRHMRSASEELSIFT